MLLHLAARFDREVENIDTVRGGQLDDWGWADRPIRGSNETSNHASATAIDLNALRHPRGRRGTFSPAQVTAIRVILAALGGVVRWGGDYKAPAVVDEMHFEINAPYGRVSDIAHRLAGTTPPKPAPPTPRPPAPGGKPTLKLGDRGAYVSQLQRIMNTRYPAYSKLQVDGVFGARTQAVIREFQKRSRIPADGVVGPVTWRKLGF